MGHEDDEVLKAGFGKLAVELESNGMVGENACGRIAEPHNEAPFLGNRGELVVAFTYPQNELLVARFPASSSTNSLGKSQFCRSGRARWKSSGMG
jgi:hypothetical protein